MIKSIHSGIICLHSHGAWASLGSAGRECPFRSSGRVSRTSLDKQMKYKSAEVMSGAHHVQGYGNGYPDWRSL